MTEAGNNLDQSLEIDGTAADFEEWSDQELKNSYYRLSEQLIHYGVDKDLRIRMKLVEEQLRERDIDPDKIIDDLWED